MPKSVHIVRGEKGGSSDFGKIFIWINKYLHMATRTSIEKVRLCESLCLCKESIDSSESVLCEKNL